MNQQMAEPQMVGGSDALAVETRRLLEKFHREGKIRAYGIAAGYSVTDSIADHVAFVDGRLEPNGPGTSAGWSLSRHSTNFHGPLTVANRFVLSVAFPGGRLPGFAQVCASEAGRHHGQPVAARISLASRFITTGRLAGFSFHCSAERASGRGPQPTTFHHSVMNSRRLRDMGKL